MNYDCCVLQASRTLQAKQETKKSHVPSVKDLYPLAEQDESLYNDDGSKKKKVKLHGHALQYPFINDVMQIPSSCKPGIRV